MPVNVNNSRAPNINGHVTLSRGRNRHCDVLVSGCQCQCVTQGNCRFGSVIIARFHRLGTGSFVVVAADCHYHNR